MADNLAVTPGTGATVAMDEVVDGTLGTVKVQYVKLMDGTLDGSTKAAVGAAGLKVDGSGATQPVSGSLTTVSTVTNLSQIGGAAVAMGTGVRSAGTQRVTIATDDVVPASQSGTWTVQPGNTANTTAWKMQLYDGTTALPILAGGSGAPAPSAPALAVSIRDVNANGQTTMSGSAPVVIASDQSAIKVTPGVSATANGATPSRINAAASTNATSLKASAGQAYGIDLFNVAAYNVFLKLYNKASAPTVGTDTPFMTIPVAAGGGVSLRWVMGLPMSTGIAYAITKLQADSDTTAVAAGDVTGLMLWI